jgi:hypothetical protein
LTAHVRQKFIPTGNAPGKKESYAWFQPWWTAYIVELKEIGIAILPHGMQIGGSLRDYPQWLVGADMPAWFFRAMRVYLWVCMAALVLSLFASDKKKIGLSKFKVPLPQALVGAIGLSFIVFVVVFVIVVAMRAPQFYNAPLQGSVFVRMPEHEGQAQSYVETGLQLGYWLAAAAGLLLVALALLRDKIVGKPRAMAA